MMATISQARKKAKSKAPNGTPLSNPELQALVETDVAHWGGSQSERTAIQGGLDAFSKGQQVATEWLDGAIGRRAKALYPALAAAQERYRKK